MVFDRYKTIKKSIYCCLAVLSMLSITVPSISAGAKPRNHASTRKVVPKAPWKEAWNAYAADESGYASVYLYPVAGQIKTGDWYKNVNKRVKVGNKRLSGSIAGWNKFFVLHQNKHSLDRNIITYPAYQHLSDAGFNARQEEKGRHWLIDVPYKNVVGLGTGGKMSPAVEADYKRAEMVADLPMSDLTTDQEQALANWAEPVKNGHRLIPSFKSWMRKNDNSPEISVNSEKFSFNQPQGFFDPTVGKNGYGETFAYNSQTHRYQRISNVKAFNQVQTRRQALLHVFDQYLRNVKRADAHNPILDSTTKKIVEHFAMQPGTSQAQAYREAIKYASSSQGKRLMYSAQRAEDAQRKSKERMTQHALTNVTNLLALESTPVFMKMNPSVSANFARYLLAHPRDLNALVNEYHAEMNGVAANNNGNAKEIVNNANKKLKNGNSNSTPQGLISDNPAVLQNLSLLHDEINLLAERQGIKLPNTTNTRLQG